LVLSFPSKLQDPDACIGTKAGWEWGWGGITRPLPWGSLQFHTHCGKGKDFGLLLEIPSFKCAGLLVILLVRKGAPSLANFTPEKCPGIPVDPVCFTFQRLGTVKLVF
jgi:hypothetical protein